MSVARRLEIFALDQDEKCFACDKPFGKQPSRLVNVAHEDQDVYVGPDCYKRIKAAGKRGYQPMKNGKPFGPRLFTMEHK
jgi:hypothetical protein